MANSKDTETTKAQDTKTVYVEKAGDNLPQGSKVEADKAKADAKRENQQNKLKQRIEDKEADWESPEELRKDGGDVHPTTTVVPNAPNPSDDPALRGTRYDGSGGKGE